MALPTCRKWITGGASAASARRAAKVLPKSLTGGGWRAVTRNGIESGPGSMDYEHDMGPYVQEMADWLDDEKQMHPCNGESAFKDLEITMALCRSVVQRGKVKLPLARANRNWKR